MLTRNVEENVFGNFIGGEQVVLVGHRLRLLEPLAYTDPDGVEYTVPVDFMYDGASIPDFAWGVVGHPFMRGYLRPAALHDYLCRTRTLPSRRVHRLFYLGLRAEGVSVWRSHTLYRAVDWFGPRWTMQ